MSNQAQLYFEDVEPGYELSSIHLLINRTHIVRFAGAGGDFNPIHHDEPLAKSSGLPSVFAMGLMHGSMLSRVVTDWAGAGAVVQYKQRFQAMVWPGDEIICSGIVRRKFEEDGRKLVECSLEVKKTNGEKAIDGSATVCLPSRNGHGMD